MIFAPWDPFSFEKTLKPTKISQPLRNHHVFYTLPKGRGHRWVYVCGISTTTVLHTCLVWVPHQLGQTCIRTYWTNAATQWWSEPCGRTPTFCFLRPPRILWWSHRSSCRTNTSRCVNRPHKSTCGWIPYDGNDLNPVYSSLTGCHSTHMQHRLLLFTRQTVKLNKTPGQINIHTDL